MGQVYSFCFGHSGRQDAYRVNEDVPKSYSWDQNKRDPKDFMFDTISNEVAGKSPGQINGQQFVIQNCQNSSLYVFDQTGSVNIDDCTDCQILLGPCKGSIFVRDCKNCKILAACQQFRSRDCENLDVFLFCQTQPIIEESKNIRFACLQLHYEQFSAQLSAADLRIFNNNWSHIHDYTPSHGNCSCLPETVNALDFVPIKRTETFHPPNVTCSSDYSDIPLSLGMRPAPSTEAAFTLCFSDDQGIESTRKRFLDLIREIQRSNTVRFVRGREVPMQQSDLERVIGSCEHKDMPKKGPVIGLEWNGPDAPQVCMDTVEKLGLSRLVYLPGPDSIKITIGRFYNYADMQLGV